MFSMEHFYLTNLSNWWQNACHVVNVSIYIQCLVSSTNGIIVDCKIEIKHFYPTKVIIKVVEYFVVSDKNCPNFKPNGQMVTPFLMNFPLTVAIQWLGI